MSFGIWPLIYDLDLRNQSRQGQGQPTNQIFKVAGQTISRESIDRPRETTTKYSHNHVCDGINPVTQG